MRISNIHSRARAWAGVTVLALLASCGGGGIGTDGPAIRSPQAAPQAAASAPASQLLNAHVLFEWAAAKYPALFSYSYYNDYDSSLSTFVYRHFSPSGNYAGVSGHDIYVLGPLTGGQLAFQGTLEQAACAVNPFACQPAPDAGAPMFMLDFATGEITRSRNANPAVGTALVGTSFTLGNALGYNLAYDAQHDRLFVPADGGKVLVLDQASLASGQAAPTRTIDASASSILWFNFVCYDQEHDVLYVAGDRTYDSAIAVYEHAGTVSGLASPDRLITVDNGHFRSLAIDFSRGIAYLGTDNFVLRIADIRHANGAINVDVDSRFSIAPYSELYMGYSGLAIDPIRDRLYVASNDYQGGVHVLSGASTASGTWLPSTFISNAYTQFVTVDASNDRVYAGAYTDALILNSASTLVTTTGALPAGAVRLKGATGMSIGGFATATTQ